MEFKSTLEREHDKLVTGAKLGKEHGLTVPPLVFTVNELIRKSPRFKYTFDEARKTAKTIQPSMSEEDIRIAVCLELTLCSQLIYNMIEDNVLKIV